MEGIWEVLLGSGISSSVVVLAFLLYTFIKKKQISSKEINTTASNNINVNSGSTDLNQLLNQEIKEIRNKVDEMSNEIHELTWSLKRISLALNYYVSNNGVPPDVKEHFKKILGEEK